MICIIYKANAHYTGKGKSKNVLWSLKINIAKENNLKTK